MKVISRLDIFPQRDSTATLRVQNSDVIRAVLRDLESSIPERRQKKNKKQKQKNKQTNKQNPAHFKTRCLTARVNNNNNNNNNNNKIR